MTTISYNSVPLGNHMFPNILEVSLFPGRHSWISIIGVSEDFLVSHNALKFDILFHTLNDQTYSYSTIACQGTSKNI